MEEYTKHSSWMSQAEQDYEWGRTSIEHGHFAQTCFIAQQVGEKALKALAFFKGFDLIKSHSIVKIAQELQVNDDILSAGRRLDLYYIAGRYPDALPDLTPPSKNFDHSQAQEALGYAQLIISFVQKQLSA